MVDILNYTNIRKRNYTFYSSKYFFGFGDDNYSCDPVRIIKLLYIFISFILNILIIIYILTRQKKKFSTALILTGNILLMNFIHTFTYSFEWILKEDDDEKIKALYILEDGTVLNNNTIEYKNYYQIGGLLIGNPDNMNVCKLQGFILVFSALSQDILINIFFMIINFANIPSKICIRLTVLILGYGFPFLTAVIYLFIDGYGINDKFCYIKKFKFEKSIKSLNEVTYKYNNSQFHTLVYLTYSFRTINLIIGLYSIVKIISYVRKNKLRNIYIFKSSSILIIQVITILVGIIYRFSGATHESFSKKFINVFLCINTLDGILFPLSYSLSNGVYKYLFCRKKMKDSIESFLDDQDDFINSDSLNTLIRKVSTKEKTFAMIDIKDANNFDLSYY